MPKQVPIETLQKLALAGTRAGLSLQYMVSLLRSGFTVEQALKLVESGLFDQLKKTEQGPPRIM
jgi:hypothetical protein